MAFIMVRADQAGAKLSVAESSSGVMRRRSKLARKPLLLRTSAAMSPRMDPQEPQGSRWRLFGCWRCPSSPEVLKALYGLA